MPRMIVVGSGIAGLFTALCAQRRGVRDVAIVTKTALEDGATRYAQGGIAAAVGAEDSSELHEADTIGAGAELCDPQTGRVPSFSPCRGPACGEPVPAGAEMHS